MHSQRASFLHAFSGPTHIFYTLDYFSRIIRAVTSIIRSILLQETFTWATFASPGLVKDRPASMNDADNEGSFAANNEIQVIQNVMISRYFAAAGLVIVLYDTLLSFEDEVSELWTRTFMLRLLFGGSPSMAGAIRNFEAALLRQPVLDDCFLDYRQLSWVQALKKLFETLTLCPKTWLGSDNRYHPL